MVCLIALLAGAAFAQEATPEPAEKERTAAAQPALTVGVMELVGLASPPPHLGLFVLLSLDVLIPLDDKWSLIPSNGFEMAPDNGNWGGFSFLIVDRVIGEVGNVVLALEPQVGVVHNAVPRPTGGFDHALYPTVGMGLAMGTGAGTVIPTTTTSFGLQGEGLSQGFIVYYSVAL